MADRVPASIIVGGNISSALVPDLVETIRKEDLSKEWDGEPFDESQFLFDGPLRLFALEVANGELTELEDFCQVNRLAFRRWSGGSSGSFAPEIVVWKGHGERCIYVADEDERAVITAEDLRRLGSYDALISYFAEAAFDVPPLSIE